MSGLLRTVPPVEEKFPGVIGDPSALKMMRRGPSEVNSSTPLVELKGLGNGPVGKPAEKGAAAGVAATEYTPTPSAAECACVCPVVFIVSRPRTVLIAKSTGAAAAVLNTT